MRFSMNGDQIRERRERLGWSQTKLARLANTHQQTISRMEASRDVLSRDLDKVLDALSAGEAESGVKAVVPPLTSVTSPSSPITYTAKDTGRFPVFGAVEAGEGIVIVSSDPVEYRPMPPHLEAVREAYGVFIENESMIPRYEPGEVAEVAPHRPVRRNVDVVLQGRGADGERRAIIKRLLGWTDTEWHIRQYNPPRDYVVSKAEWPECHIVIGRQAG